MCVLWQHTLQRRELYTGFWSGDLKGRGRPRWADNIKMGGRLWTGLIYFRTGPMAGCCEYGHEPWVSIRV